ncbi:MAG: alpha/beta fold hydrolase [Vicinamibacterales bacterium]
MGEELLGQAVAITLDGGRRTTAMRYAAPASAASTLRIVLAHGAGAGQRHPFITGIARQLAATGIEVWTFNFLYMEQKRRAPDTAPALEHCFRRAIDVAQASSGKPAALLIGGKSMGGRIATHLAAQGDRVNGVFALGYPLHPPGKPEQLRSAHLPAITVPVLIVQGERDAFGTPSELAPVIATMKAPVTLAVVSGGDHSLGVRGQPADELYAWLANLIANWARTSAGKTERRS